MDINEVMDDVQEVLDRLRLIADEHPDNAAIQRNVARAALAGADAIKRLSLMLLYKDDVPAMGAGQDKEDMANGQHVPVGANGGATA